MRRPKPHLGRMEAVEDGILMARCSCGRVFQAATDYLVVGCWIFHACKDKPWRHRKLSPDEINNPCTHWQSVPCYEFATGEVVAWLCTDCDRQFDERPPLTPDPRLTARIKE